MDAARSIPRNPDVLSRHPSAEDLDAAQQLISSAQAGREHMVDRPWEDNQNGRPVEVAESVHSESSVANDKSSPKSQKDSSFLGHSCRYVFREGGKKKKKKK